MCLSKHFKKEDYESINESGRCLYKSNVLKGEIVIKNCVLKAERIEAQDGLMRLKIYI